MAHKHSVYDGDTHFIINAITKQIKNDGSKKTTLIQGDHNSERFSFDMPRIVEGHDMTQCNLVEVHYTNKGAEADEGMDDYSEIKDLQISPDDPGTLVFSWQIDGNATMYAGTLEFSVKFRCTSEGYTEYEWNTLIFEGITIARGKNNSGAVAERQPNVHDQWREEIFGNAENAVANINLAEKAALQSVQDEGASQLEKIHEAGEDIANAAAIAEQNAKNVLANAIKGHMKGEVVTADDVSSIQHEMAVKVRGKNLLNIDAMLNKYLRKNEDGTYTITRGANRFSEYAALSIPANTTITISCVGLLDDGFRSLTVQFTFTDGTTAYVNMSSTIQVYTRTYDKEVCRACIYLLPDAAVDDYKTFTGIQVEIGETATEYTPYIDPSTVNVRRCGKNLFDINNYTVVSANLTANEHTGNDYTVQGAVGNAANAYSAGAFAIVPPVMMQNVKALTMSMYVTLLEQGAWGNKVRLWAMDENVEYADSKTFELEIGKRTRIQATFLIENADVISRMNFHVNNNKLLFELDTIQIEEGTDVTEYEAYKGTDHTPSSDGTVSGMMSTAPNMTILTDKEGVIVECEYNVDTKLYIDKKFEELKALIQA